MFDFAQKVGISALMYLPGAGLVLHGLLRAAAASRTQGGQDGFQQELVRSGRSFVDVSAMTGGVRAAAIRLESGIGLVLACPYRAFSEADPEGKVWRRNDEDGDGLVPNPLRAGRQAQDELLRLSGPGIRVEGAVAVPEGTHFVSGRPTGVLSETRIPEFLVRAERYMAEQGGTQGDLDAAWQRIKAAAKAPAPSAIPSLGALLGFVRNLPRGGWPIAAGLGWFVLLMTWQQINDALLELVAGMMG